MELLIIGGAVGVYLYNTFSYKIPEPEDGNQEGNTLPAPRFLYSNPAIWTSAPVDVSYRPYKPFFGPNNDPRNAFLLTGGARVVHSGYNPVVRTNQAWPTTYPKAPSPRPGYEPEPITAIGEKQRVSSRSVFTE